jgi:hypothetical protein
MSSITWKAQQPAVTGGGDVGGDYQAGEAWSVRLVSDQAPGALIDVYVFAEARLPDQDDGAPYHVQVMTEYLTCTDMNDPGGTETWSDYVYPAPGGHAGYDDGTGADKAAWNLAAAFAAHPEIFSWDGKPFYQREDKPVMELPVSRNKGQETGT